LNLPTFIFIGPDKSGSSWLYEILREHPECYVPPIKDIYFFDRYYDRGMEWYSSFFKDARKESIAIGELSHDYLFSSVARERIFRDLPGVKLLTCLRNPVERTFSHYLFMIRSGLTRMPFEIALDRFPELINNSCYHKYLSEYLSRFDTSQIKVLYFENLQSDPAVFAKEVFDFLELSFVGWIDYHKKVLPASRPRSFILARFAKLGANAFRRIGLGNLVGRIKRSFLLKILYTPYDMEHKPAIEDETVSRLNSIFRDDVLRLQALLKTDLSDWLIFERKDRS
jgi:hypothetical protein